MKTTTLLFCLAYGAYAAPIGIFENHQDIGSVLHTGSAVYDAAKNSYTVTASGDNMWAAEDDFHFVWKKVNPGDLTFTADVRFLGAGGNPHRKGVLMIRRSLDQDSDYVDAAVHGVGLTSLQSRDAKGATTREVQAAITAPRTLRLVKRGDDVFLLAGDRDNLQLTGGSMKISLNQPFYVGLGVCSHDKDAVEKVDFSNVELKTEPASTLTPTLYSTLEIVPVESTDRRAVYVMKGRVEGPNWTLDGKTLFFNQDGKLWRVSAAGGKPEPVELGNIKAGHHHGISPDGKTLAITDESGPQAAIFALPLAGGAPRQLTPQTPSYWKGWSPDGRSVVYTARRNGKLGMYTIRADGGDEAAVAAGDGANDDPVYSPDGKYLYFQSDRTGSVQIWRSAPDGSHPEQVTDDEFANYSPHVSPDGLQVAFLSGPKNAPAYPRDTDVKVRTMVLQTRATKVIANLIGGRGSFDAQPWSPDSSSLSFISYQLLR